MAAGKALYDAPVFQRRLEEFLGGSFTSVTKENPSCIVLYARGIGAVRMGFGGC